MAGQAMNGGGRGLTPWRLAGWGGAAALLLTPLAAMQFTDQVRWTAFDFAVAGGLLAAVGLGLEMAVRRSGSLAYRAGAAVAILTAFLLIWANLAVGFIGSEDNPANLMFLGVLAVALAGAILSGFRPRGMAWSMVAAAVLQAAIPTYAILAGLGSDDPITVIAPIIAVYTGAWLLAAALFAKAAREARVG